MQLTDITLAETKFRKVDNDLVLFGYHEASVGWVQICGYRLRYGNKLRWLLFR